MLPRFGVESNSQRFHVASIANGGSPRFPYTPTQRRCVSVESQDQTCCLFAKTVWTIHRICPMSWASQRSGLRAIIPSASAEMVFSSPGEKYFPQVLACDKSEEVAPQKMLKSIALAVQNERAMPLP